jgi:membrane protein implicated in regulation of membrane protease activity
MYCRHEVYMVERYEQTLVSQVSSLLWAGYALVLIAGLAYLFSEFFFVPRTWLVVLFAIGAVLLVLGYATTRKKQVEKKEEKKGFRMREF